MDDVSRGSNPTIHTFCSLVLDRLLLTSDTRHPKFTRTTGRERPYPIWINHGQLSRLGKVVQSVEYGVCERTIYRSAKKYGDISLEEKRTLTTQECDMLLRRVTKLENIVTILKTVNCTVHAPLKETLHELELLL